jgi:molybdopterin synthase sulfur carrier subunit
LKSIKISYFASLREKAGTDTEEMQFEGSLQELYETLKARHGFSLPPGMVQVAVNDEFALMSDTVSANSKVVFIPPVAGG